MHNVRHLRGNVLAVGPPRSRKQLFAQEFIADGLKAREKILVVLTNSFPEDLVRELQSRLGSFPVADRLYLVDCYSRYAGIPVRDEERCVRVSGPSSLREIQSGISRYLELHALSRTVFYSASPLLMRNTPAAVERFFHAVLGRLRLATNVLLMDDFHSAEERTVLEQIADTVVPFSATW